MKEEFGIIIACCDQDYLFAKGCCASIRYFLGDIPICLIVDGKLDTIALEQTYGVQVIRQADVSSHYLRERSFGFGLTKMIAFWESSWKNFLYIDADIVLCQNILEIANFAEFDLIVHKSDYTHSEQDISQYFFNIPKMATIFPDFNWKAYQKYYFNAGIFFGKRDIFTLDEYMAILDLVEQEPDLFRMGEQGFFNFMVCWAAQCNRIRLGQAPLQLIAPDYNDQQLQQQFSHDASQLAYLGKHAVIHWCGPHKPTYQFAKIYAAPMTFFRRKFMRDYRQDAIPANPGSQPGRVHRLTIQCLEEMRLSLEDLHYYIIKYKNKLLRKLGIKPKYIGVK